MSNIRGIEGGKKNPCPYCGAAKSCPDFTCPRIASVWSDDVSWEIEFRENWTPPDEPAA